MTELVGWRLCLIVFKTFSDRSGIRTHAHTRVPEFSTEEFLESGALDRSAILAVLRRHFSVWSVLFNWVEFAFQSFNLLNGLCHPFVKICVSTHTYIRASHVPPGCLFFVEFQTARLSTTDDVAIFFVFLLCTVILNWCCSMIEFVSWRLFLIVFKTFCDRNRIRTHAHTRVQNSRLRKFLSVAS